MTYMLVKKEEEIVREWEKYKGFTIRPEKSTIDYYQKWIRCYRHCQEFLLYGGTPEIRNIFQEEKLSLTMVDQLEVMVRAMGRLTSGGMPINAYEKFELLDWLELFKLNKKFSLLIGDDAINMLPEKKFTSFLKIASELLAPDGIFICHLLVRPSDDLILKSFSDILYDYKQGKISHFDLASQLNFICYDKNTKQMGWQQTIHILGKRLNQFLPHFNFKNLFGQCNSTFTCLSQNLFEGFVNQFFTIKEIFYPHEHQYCLFEPVYILSKK